MSFHEIVALHKIAFTTLVDYWPLLVFILLAEMFLILKSRQYTRRGAVEATLSTAIPFLIAFWGVSVAPESIAVTEDGNAAVTVSPWLPVILTAGALLVRATILQIFFQTRTVWEYLASIPLPAFVYFSGYIALK